MQLRGVGDDTRLAERTHTVRAHTEAMWEDDRLAVTTVPPFSLQNAPYRGAGESRDLTDRLDQPHQGCGDGG
jgi:hypothetical protein